MKTRRGAKPGGARPSGKAKPSATGATPKAGGATSTAGAMPESGEQGLHKREPGQRYSPAQVIAALEASAGVVLGAAQKLRCTSQTIYNYIDRYPEVASAKDQAREDLIDLAESQIIKAVAAGNLTACIFVVKTQGKARGWSERTELATPDDKPLQVSFDWSKLPIDALKAMRDAVAKQPAPAG